MGKHVRPRRMLGGLSASEKAEWARQRVRDWNERRTGKQVRPRPKFTTREEKRLRNLALAKVRAAKRRERLGIKPKPRLPHLTVADKKRRKVDLQKERRRNSGCTSGFLKGYIEARFKRGMTWENKNLWELDHRIPCAAFDLNNPIHQRQCFHYSNLQPLWRIENRRKHVTLPGPHQGEFL